MKDHTQPNIRHLTRRRLLQFGAGLGAGLVAVSCAPAPSASPPPAAPASTPAPAKPAEPQKPVAAPTTATKSPAPATAAPAKPKQVDTVDLRMDWVLSGIHTSFYVGIGKGFYAEQGISLDIKDGQGSNSTATLVGTDKNMVGLAAATAIVQNVQQGVPVKAIAGMFRKSGIGITYLTESGISKPQDLKGKRFADSAGSAVVLMLPAFLAANGMSASDLEIVNADAAVQVTLLLAGKVDCIATAGGVAGGVRGATGRPTGNLFFADWGVQQMGQAVIAGDTVLADKPDLIRRFLAGTIKSWSYSWENIDEAATILNKMKPDFPKSSALEVMKDTKQLLYSKATQGKPLGWMAPEDIQATIDVTTGPLASAQAKDLPKPTVDKVATNEFLPK